MVHTMEMFSWGGHLIASSQTKSVWRMQMKEEAGEKERKKVDVTPLRQCGSQGREKLMKN